jgi:hypothetical protein
VWHSLAGLSLGMLHRLLVMQCILDVHLFLMGFFKMNPLGIDSSSTTLLRVPMG